jgi:hypothetical protein
MATRSTIALEFADGTVEQVYCHWDGYLEHNGQILLKHYSDPFKLQRLIDLGAISSLGPEIGEKQDFDKRDTQNDNWSLIYARDRGEDLVKHKFKDYADYKANAQSEEYNYILRTDGKWYVEFYGEFDGLLEQAIMDEQDAKAQEEIA